VVDLVSAATEGRRDLAGLRPQAYEHPDDRQALDILQDTSGLETVVRKCNEWGFERLLRVQLTGSNIRVTADSFPDIHRLLLRACRALDLPLEPELYLGGGGEINAFTAGVERPIVVLTSGAVDLLSEDELFFVIGHELGHIKSGHVLYYQIAEFLPVIGEIIGSATFGIGELLGAGLQIALLNWKRKSEFTADRAGLLATQDVTTSLSAMMKLAGLPQKYYDRVNVDDFIVQARAFEAMDNDKLDWIAKWLSSAGQSHPWTVLRANQFLTWIDDGGYEQVLAAPSVAPLVLPSGVKRFCPRCGYGLAGPESFCPGCGNAVATLS
jgi:Zn-dependent protease with chaperone function